MMAGRVPIATRQEMERTLTGLTRTPERWSLSSCENSARAERAEPRPGNLRFGHAFGPLHAARPPIRAAEHRRPTEGGAALRAARFSVAPRPVPPPLAGVCVSPAYAHQIASDVQSPPNCCRFAALAARWVALRERVAALRQTQRSRPAETVGQGGRTTSSSRCPCTALFAMDRVRCFRFSCGVPSPGAERRAGLGRWLVSLVKTI